MALNLEYSSKESKSSRTTSLKYSSLFYDLFKGKKVIATKSVAACFDWNGV